MIADLKPYPEYKESGLPWLGRVPEHWEIRPAVGAFEPIRVRNSGLREKTILSLSYGRIIVKSAGKLHGLVPESFETYQIVNPGDIVVRTTDLQNDHTSLRVGMVRKRGIITSAYLSLKVKDGIDPDFGFQILNVWDISKAIYGYGSGLRQNLDFSHFKRMPVALPSISEQDAIVRFLNWANGRLDQAIRAKRKIIKLLDEQKQVIIQLAVTRGLEPDVKLKPSGVEGLGDIPAHWKITKLKFVASVQTGITLGKQYNKLHLSERPYLRVANVQSGRLDLRRIKSVNVPDSEARSCALMNGDVLLTEGGDIDKLGRGCLWRGEIPNCIHQNHIFAVRTNASKLIPEFLAALSFSGHGRRYFQTTAKQTTNLASTNSTTVRDFPLVVPPIDEQGLILEYIDKKSTGLNSAISRLEREIDLLREYRTRIVSDVVTGKLDVREAAAKLPAEVEVADTETNGEDEEMSADEDMQEDEGCEESA